MKYSERVLYGDVVLYSWYQRMLTIWCLTATIWVVPHS